MSRIWIVIAIAIALMPLAVLAEDAPPTQVLQFKTGAGSTDLLSGVALNAVAATRTITLPTGNRFAKLRVAVTYTYGSATTLTAQMTCALNGTSYVTNTTRACVAGTCTLSQHTDSYTTGAASAAIGIEFDVRGCQNAKIVFGGAGAGGSDLVTVQATAIVGA